ncbi:helix-turn-helix domain-containing protein [Methylobacterium aquaticum]|jgi:two-component system, cell cycle response regulator CtrA|uniref:helix-turn-helix domain-containing protein n=1 Tax=Methylobacterium aquaticum TaxID=270351 RepID=UPI00069CCBAD|nr:helix-turn-helix domain-containing protein [Methylobacterium aquaticum]
MNKLAHCLDEGVSPHIVRGMRDQIDLLEEQVRQYREAAESTPLYPAEWGLTPKEARLVGTLVRARGNVVSRSRLMVALYGLEPDVEPKIVDVFVCKIRKKLRSVDVAVKIRNRHGEGFVLAAQDADHLARVAADMEEPEADTAALAAQVAELEADNARLAADLEAAIAKLAASQPAPPPPETRQRRTWRKLAASQVETRNRPAAGLRGGAAHPMVRARFP